MAGLRVTEGGVVVAAGHDGAVADIATVGGLATEVATLVAADAVLTTAAATAQTVADAAATSAQLTTTNTAVALNTGARKRAAALGPTGALAETVDRNLGTVNGAAVAAGTLRVALVQLYAGQVYTNVVAVSATTAAVDLTAQWAVLAQASDLTVLRKSADKTTEAWAANSTKTYVLATTYTPAADILCYVGFIATGTTLPTVKSRTGDADLNTLPPVRAGTSTTGLTDPTSLGASIGAVTAAAGIPYIYLT